MIAIALSDIHLSHTAPVSRADPDWYQAMARPLREVKALQEKHGVPILCAGDVFDRWNPPCELVNFAIDELPNMIAIPGQHDLPHHRYEDIEKSGYWTLVKAGRLENVETNRPIHGAMVWGFPWGKDVTPPDIPLLDGFHLAIIHAYIWRKDCSYPGANLKQHVKSWRKRLEGYRIACFGDNHKGFLSLDDDLTILNCGGLMRRKSDEQFYKPSVGLIWSDENVTRHYLDTSQDVLLSTKEVLTRAVERAGGFQEFLESVRTLGEVQSDFIGAVKEAMEKKQVNDKVRAFVVNALEGEK